ncbi:MAG: hypothetical protein LBM28_07405 [Oscillospiraceae bacterium]|nr:hypothetical protein [Oscillospiraceae bacterium]
MSYKKNQSADDYIKMFTEIFEPVQNIERDFYHVYARMVESLAACMQHLNKGDDYKLAREIPKVFSWFCSLIYKSELNRQISFDDIVWNKYPLICPYCKMNPCMCRGKRSALNTDELVDYRKNNADKRPKTLSDWQNMFANLYPRDVQGYHMSSNINHLIEELGEISEAYRLRFFSIDNLYFELSDAFTWIIGIANLLDAKAQADSLHGITRFRLDHEVYSKFPGICQKCGSHICLCSGAKAKISEYHEIKQIVNLNEKIDRAVSEIQLTINDSVKDLLHTREFRDFTEDVLSNITDNHISKDELSAILEQVVQKPEHRKWYKDITLGGLAENSLVSLIFLFLQIGFRR